MWCGKTPDNDFCNVSGLARFVLVRALDELAVDDDELAARHTLSHVVRLPAPADDVVPLRILYALAVLFVVVCVRGERRTRYFSPCTQGGHLDLGTEVAHEGDTVFHSLHDIKFCVSK